MKIVIVEDEIQIREGLVGAISKLTNHQIVGTASDGSEGCTLIRNTHPDLVITDIRMPIINGLSMIRKLKKEGIDPYVILLTGYSEFDYAREAVKLGIKEYLLKPIDVSNLLAVLTEAEDSINSIKKREVSVEQLLWSYLTCLPEKHMEYKKMLEKALRINSLTRIDLYMLEIYKGNMRGEGKEIFDFIQNRAKMQVFDTYFILPVLNGQEFVCGFLDVNDQLHITRFWEKRIIPDMPNGTKCVISTTNLYGLEDLPAKVDQLREMNRYGFELGNGRIITRDRIDSIERAEITYPSDIERQACLAIQEGDCHKAIQLCRDFISRVVETSALESRIKEYSVTFSETIAHYIVKNLKVDKAELSIQLLAERILASRTKSELKDCLTELTARISGAEQIATKTDNMMVLEAISYIRENFQRDITLTGTAHHIGVSPEHLSRLFSQELNLGFSSFLRDFRVSIAKRMILTGRYKIREVAERTGYNDVKYFIKVFKNVCGMTPSEFSNKHEGQNSGQSQK